MAGLGESLIKRGASIRRSLKLGAKKDKPLCRQETVEESMEEKEEKKEEEEVVWEDIEESYTLPEIPHTPLSGTCSRVFFYTRKVC